MYLKALTSLALSLAIASLAGCYYDRSATNKGTITADYTGNFDSWALYEATGKKIGTVKMVKNKSFCRPSEGGKSLEFAPVILPPKTSAPTEEEYNAAGWYFNAVEPPSPPEGKVVGSTTYVIDHEDNVVVAVYEYVDPPPPALEDYDMAMEEFLRQERDERGYTTREPDSYLTSQVPRWAQDAKDWVAHRDAVMEYALELINEVSAGTRPPPTMEEFLENMPKIVWTYQGE